MVTFKRLKSLLFAVSQRYDVVDFSDEINQKDIREMKEYQLLRIEEDGY